MGQGSSDPAHHPWRLTPREVRFTRLDGLLGAWDPDTGIIWLDSRLTQAERRCTLAHEAVHAERGDEPCATDWHERRQESVVEQEAARRLISLDNLADALAWTQDEWEVAHELWVDVDTARARIAGLTEVEKAYIERRVAAKGEVA